ADVHRRLGERDQAETEFRLAKTIQERLVALDPRSLDYRFELTLTLESLASVHRGPQAVPEYLEVIRLQEKLVEEQPEHFEYKRRLAVTQDALGGLLLGDPKTWPRAEQHFLKAAGILEELIPLDNAAKSACDGAFARTQSSLGRLYEATHRHDLAVAA